MKYFPIQHLTLRETYLIHLNRRNIIKPSEICLLLAAIACARLITF